MIPSHAVLPVEALTRALEKAKAFKCVDCGRMVGLDGVAGYLAMARANGPLCWFCIDRHDINAAPTFGRGRR